VAWARGVSRVRLLRRVQRIQVRERGRQVRCQPSANCCVVVVTVYCPVVWSTLGTRAAGGGRFEQRADGWGHGANEELWRAGVLSMDGSFGGCSLKSAGLSSWLAIYSSFNSLPSQLNRGSKRSHGAVDWTPRERGERFRGGRYLRGRHSERTVLLLLRSIRSFASLLCCSHCCCCNNGADLISLPLPRRANLVLVLTGCTDSMGLCAGSYSVPAVAVAEHHLQDRGHRCRRQLTVHRHRTQ